jgi:hypothetical protein
MSVQPQSPPAAPEGLEGEALTFTAWGQAQGLTDIAINILIGCFTPGYLHSLPKPTTLYRRSGFSGQEHRGYL